MLENNGHYTEGTDTILGGDGQYSRGETDSIKACKGGDRHFTRGTGTLQRGNGHYTKGGKTIDKRGQALYKGTDTMQKGVTNTLKGGKDTIQYTRRGRTLIKGRGINTIKRKGTDNIQEENI